jgi:hypothetical protein
MAKIQYTVRMEESLFQKLRAIADTERRSFNNQVEYAIAQYVEAYGHENAISKAILEGLSQED